MPFDSRQSELIGAQDIVELGFEILPEECFRRPACVGGAHVLGDTVCQLLYGDIRQRRRTEGTYNRSIGVLCARETASSSCV